MSVGNPTEITGALLRPPSKSINFLCIYIFDVFPVSISTLLRVWLYRNFMREAEEYIIKKNDWFLKKEKEKNR